MIEKKFKFAYPGSFDPWTKGHLSVLLAFLERDPDANVDIILARNPQKGGMFSLEERKFIIQQSIPPRFLNRVRVTIVSGVVADYMYENNIPYFIKGIRDESDYRYETNLATLNSQFYGSPMTLLIPQVNFDLNNVSSSNLKMLTNLGISLDRYATAFVREIIKMKTTGKLLIGVTGGITSGKSTFCRRLQEYAHDKSIKIHYLNMDQLGYSVMNDHKEELPVYQKIRDQIANEFGHHVLNEDGTINRKELGHIVFSNPSQMERLTNLLLEPLLYLMGQKINAFSSGIILVESAILFDRHLTELVDENIILIYVDPTMQKQRLQESRHHSIEQAQKRIDSQMSLQKIRESIQEIQKGHYDRLFCEYRGDTMLDDEAVSKIYQHLESQYLLRQEVRRTSNLFVPQELSFYDDNVFMEDIIAQYSTPDRHYHNITHIKELLVHYLKIRHLLTKPSEVYLAVIFHDICHNPQISGNEENSARYAYKYLQTHLSSSNVDLDIVERLIQLTAHHDQELGHLTHDEELFLDMDMAIFASHYERLMEYEKQIYQEYAFISREQYRTGRVAFLQKLLQKKVIYRSTYFQTRYESQARENMQILCDFVQMSPAYQ